MRWTTRGLLFLLTIEWIARQNIDFKHNLKVNAGVELPIKQSVRVLGSLLLVVRLEYCSSLQWSSSVALDSSKYGRGYSDERLSNTLGNHNINKIDFRKLKGSTWSGGKNKCHAFTRVGTEILPRRLLDWLVVLDDCISLCFQGDVITGWDHSTHVKPVIELKGSPDSRTNRKLPHDYISPAVGNWTAKNPLWCTCPLFTNDRMNELVMMQEAEAQFLEQCRMTKRQGDSHFGCLVRKYGKEGALAMVSIETMPRWPIIMSSLYLQSAKPDML